MIVFKTVAELQKHLQTEQKSGARIGFIPTMGALHHGHISLISKAKEDGALAVCSIFVNPAQFNDKKDFEKYPSTVAQDIVLLDEAKCDILFLPSVQEIYPKGEDAAKSYDFGFLETVYEGAKRPGHFKGVGKVVAILLEIVQPNILYMGSKDYQQCMVVKDLCQQMGLSNRIRFEACPTQREPDGLAMSSRNRRLGESERSIAAIIYQCLISIQNKATSGMPFPIVEKECTELMLAKGLRPEYIGIANADSLKPLTDFDPAQKMVALIAAWVGDVRLIDNMILN